MSVRLGDDADAGPAGVAEQSDASMRGLEGPAQQGITCEVGPKRSSVVTKLPNLGSCLIDERQRVGRRLNGVRLEQWVGAAISEQHGQRFGLNVVAPHVQMHASRIAATHFESIDRRESLLDNQVAGERRGRRCRAGQRRHFKNSPQTIVGDRPHRILQRDQVGARPFECIGVEARVVAIETRLDLGGEGHELIGSARD